MLSKQALKTQWSEIGDKHPQWQWLCTHTDEHCGQAAAFWPIINDVDIHTPTSSEGLCLDHAKELGLIGPKYNHTDLGGTPTVGKCVCCGKVTTCIKTLSYGCFCTACYLMLWSLTGTEPTKTNLAHCAGYYQVTANIKCSEVQHIITKGCFTGGTICVEHMKVLNEKLTPKISSKKSIENSIEYATQNIWKDVWKDVVDSSPVPELNRGEYVRKQGLKMPFAADHKLTTAYNWNKPHAIDHDYPDSSKEIAEKLGVERHFNLNRCAADFYLLTEASILATGELATKVKTRLTKHTNYSAEQMARYIEAACFGEARYASGKVKLYDYTPRFLKNPKWMKLYKELTAGLDRYDAWERFKKCSATYGRNNVILFTIQIHDKLPWSGSFGGKKWALCAKTVFAYRRGKMSPTAFVDTAFGLEHNGNVVFDKLWNVETLKYVLDLNLNDNLPELADGYASTEAKELWKLARQQAED